MDRVRLRRRRLPSPAAFLAREAWVSVATAFYAPIPRGRIG